MGCLEVHYDDMILNTSLSTFYSLYVCLSLSPLIPFRTLSNINTHLISQAKQEVTLQTLCI